MPINTDLNIAPYFDDYDLENQYYRVLFKPGYAVQARELTQLQTILQSQIEQFGDNIFKEGSIIKGCNFTDISDLQFVRLADKTDFDPTLYISREVIETINTVDTKVDYVYEVTGSTTGLKAKIISAARGFSTRPPDFNTFFITYLNTNEVGNYKTFEDGELLSINLYKYKVGELDEGETNPFAGPLAQTTINATDLIASTGPSFGIQSGPGVIFLKGAFVFADEQVLVVSKYTDQPDGISVGYQLRERLISALQDNTLYDNANGSENENAPGADRLALIPELTAASTAVAESSASFFTLVRYSNGQPVTLRDVSQYNVIGSEMARRTFEESGNYILQDYEVTTSNRDSEVQVNIGTGVAYIKGYRVENSGEQSFTIDPIVNTEVQTLQPISFNYGGWLPITGYAGHIPLNYEQQNLLNVSNGVIGTCYVTNITVDRVYLFGVRFLAGQSYADVAKIDSPTQGTITIDSAYNSLRSSGQNAFLFDSGMSSLKSITNAIVPVRVVEAVNITADTITLNADPNEDFAVNNSDAVLIDATGLKFNVLSAVTSNNNTVLTITLQAGAAATGQLYYNKNKVLIEPYNKVDRDCWIRASYSSSITKYSLGFPDVRKITKVQDASGNDFTDSFRLVSNQKDRFYGISYMEYIAGRPQPAGVIQIRMNVFEINISTGEYFFTVNSYPNTLDANEIPVYTSSLGRKCNLRECIDMRPYVNKDPNASYTAVNAGTAPFMSEVAADALTPSFTNYGAPLIPALGESARATIEYYLSRVDLVAIDSYGEIKIIKGEEERFSTPPKPEADQLAISEITIPGFPALAPTEANAQGKQQYAIRAKSKGYKNYTMKDLHSLEKKIDNMAYYISLNQLESETANFNVTDENGLNRFKNGFIVDPFNDLNLANVNNPEFSAAVGFVDRQLTPSIKTFPIDLKYKSGSGVSTFDNNQVISLTRNANISLLSQPYASDFRNCVSNFYQYTGQGEVYPPYDAAYDTSTNPVNIEIDFATPIQEAIDNIQEFIPLTQSTSSVSGADPVTAGGVETTTTTTLQIETETSKPKQVGEFVSDFRFQPFMSGRDISIYMSGLRPNTRHYFYFDKQDVNAHVMPGTPTSDRAFFTKRYGAKGAAVSSDANGILRAVFSIPEGTFYVGERILEIADVNQYNSIESAGTSGGLVQYRAYNFSVEKSSLTTSTRSATFDQTRTTSTRNLPSRPIPPAPRVQEPVRFRFGRNDPLAQTFFIKQGMGRGSNSVFISQVDLYFKRKSAINGVNVMLREVINGYPTADVLPFSKTHLLPAAVAISDDASLATTVTFSAPVRLDVEKEYAIVVMPDANDPDYLIFTSKVGGVDLTPGITQGQSIVQDWGDGVLFTSTNNRAWKSYQDEDIKFNLYRHNFSSSSGVAVLTNNDNEFLTVGTIGGRFNLGETIYQIKSVGGAGATVSITAGTAIVNGTGLDNTYAAGDYVLVQNTGLTQKALIRVASVQSAIQLTLEYPVGFQVSGGPMNPAVIGDLSYYNYRYPETMHLEKSSADASRQFENSEIIYGLDSGSNATITTVDNLSISYFQPMIIKANDSASSTTLSGNFVPPSDVNSTYSTGLKFNDNNTLNKSGAVIFSRSNDPSSTKAFELTVSMANGDNATSTPILDAEVSKLIAYTYSVTEDPDTTARYVSKTVELAEDLDAEDINVIVTGYKPLGSDIKVYIKPQNAVDSASFDAIDWIELELFEGKGVFSSDTNLRDFREYRYRVSSTNLTGGVLQYTSTAGTFEGFRTFAIKIALTSPNNYSVPKLKDYRAIALT